MSDGLTYVSLFTRGNHWRNDVYELLKRLTSKIIWGTEGSIEMKELPEIRMVVYRFVLL